MVHSLKKYKKEWSLKEPKQNEQTIRQIKSLILF